MGTNRLRGPCPLIPARNGPPTHAWHRPSCVQPRRRSSARLPASHGDGGRFRGSTRRASSTRVHGRSCWHRYAVAYDVLLTVLVNHRSIWRRAIRSGRSLRLGLRLELRHRALLARIDEHRLDLAARRTDRVPFARLPLPRAPCRGVQWVSFLVRDGLEHAIRHGAIDSRAVLIDLTDELACADFRACVFQSLALQPETGNLILALGGIRFTAQTFGFHVMTLRLVQLLEIDVRRLADVRPRALVAVEAPFLGAHDRLSSRVRGVDLACFGRTDGHQEALLRLLVLCLLLAHELVALLPTLLVLRV